MRSRNKNGGETPGDVNSVAAAVLRQQQRQHRLKYPQWLPGHGEDWAAPWGMIVLLVVFRVCNSMLIQTYFNPDEYWQGVEVAHELAFSPARGSSTLGELDTTWEWKDDARIRGVLHPLIFAVVYRALALLGLDSAVAVAHGGHVVQGVLAAVGDLYTYKLARKLMGKEVAKYALLAACTNWFSLYAMVRTFSNSMEAVFTVVALYHWPWLACFQRCPPALRKESHARLWLRSRWKALVFASVACAVRPTNAVVWLALGVRHVAHLDQVYAFPQNLTRMCTLLFREVVPIAAVWITLTVFLDSYFYGRFTFVPGNFVLFNVLQGGSSLYGTHPPPWYLYEGWPTILGSYAPLLLWTWRRAGALSEAVSELAWLLALVTAFFSLNAHKEHRFVLPVLPPALLLVAVALRAMAHARRRWAGRLAVAGLVCVQLGMAAYLGVLHQRGAVQAVRTLAQVARPGDSVDFLCGCHSTPWHSQVHAPVLSMRYLDCSPRKVPELQTRKKGLRRQKLTMQGTETHLFEHDPLMFVQAWYGEAAKAQSISLSSFSSSSSSAQSCGRRQDESSCLEAACQWLYCKHPQDSNIRASVCTQVAAASQIGALCERAMRDPTREHLLTAAQVTYRYTDAHEAFSWRVQDDGLDQWITDHLTWSSWVDRGGGETRTLHYKKQLMQADESWRLLPAQDGHAWLYDELTAAAQQAQRDLPDWIVTYSSWAASLFPFLQTHGYVLHRKVWHSHLGDTQFLYIYRKQA